ncbi:MAG: diacylglycerol O-acyltransferase / wax synthase [bacterium]
MAHEQFDRLTGIDASFLHQEGPASHMHVGAVTLFEGPPPPVDELLDTLRSRLHLVPRYRQKLAVPPAGTGRPLWVDDPAFNIEYHVRHSALPRPGTEDELRRLAARIFSQQLDRSRPLWEIWLVEGVEGGRFALVHKTHHAMIDGIGGVDLAQLMFDLGPAPTEIEHPDEPWRPAPVPTPAEVLASGARDLMRTGVRGATQAVGMLARPQEALHAAREAAEGVGEVVWAGLNPAPPTPLNVPIGPHRRYAMVRNELSDLKLVKDAFGGTVNDVVLAVVSGALRDWLQSRGVRTEGLELRALVPVSIRASHEHGTMGNRLAAMRGPLPVYIDDPLLRLGAVREAMEGLKESKQAVGAEVLAGVQNFAPPTILAQASRLNFSTRLFNLLVTNVPGPQFPLYVRGHELLDVFPVAFLPRDHALAVAIMSYNGHMNFGLLGDYDAMADIDTLAEGIEASLAELVALARAAGDPGSDGRSAPSGRAARASANGGRAARQRAGA